VVAGITATLAADALPVPLMFVAVTVNVYEVPLVRPLTVQVSTPNAVQNAFPGLAVTVYRVIAERPSLAGAFHETTALLAPNVATTAVGASGTVVRTTVTESEAALVPALLTATTVKSKTLRPLTVTVHVVVVEVQVAVERAVITR